jgi:hypothetical protein
MATLIELKRRRIRANFFPDFPIKLRKNSLTAGLTLAVIGGRSFDLVSGRVATGASPTPVSTLRGRGANYPAGTESSFGNLAAVSGADQTIIAYCNPAGDASIRPIFSDRNGDQITFAANLDSATFAAASGRLTFFVSAGGALTGFEAAGVIDGNYHIYGGARSGTGGQLYVDGIPVTTTTVGAPGSPTFASGHITKVGRHEGTLLSLRADLGFALVWNRRLSDAEIAEASRSLRRIVEPANDSVWVPVSVGGGATYNVSIAETASAVDALSAILAGIATVAETGAAVSTSSAAMTATASVAESGSATDSTSTGGATTSASITETGAAAETTGAALIGTASVAETGAATDSQAASALFVATRSDVLAAADTTSTGGAITSAAVAETGAATDSTSAIATFLAGVAEIGAAMDSQNATAVLNAAWSDALNAADSQNWGGSVISVSLSEALNALDSQSASTVFAASVTESGAALDSTSCILIANASISEVLAALDSTSVQLITSATIAEALSALDTTSVVNLNFIAAASHILAGRARVTVLVGKERILVIY